MTRKEKIAKAWAEYVRVRNAAYAEYEGLSINTTHAECKRSINTAHAEYVRVHNAAYAKYRSIINPAYAEFERILETAEGD